MYKFVFGGAEAGPPLWEYWTAFDIKQYKMFGSDLNMAAAPSKVMQEELNDF